ncbi:MAG: type II toxin-antitoxin system RelE/ParE family toxin [Actinomycetota bacterium]
MDVEFDTAKLQRLCSTEKQLVRRFGPDRGRKTMLRLQQLEAADTLDDMRTLPGRCHELTGDRSGQLAIDLNHPYRLIFRPRDPIPHTPEGSLDWGRVTAVVVLDITDYH